MVDTRALRARAANTACEFESRPRHMQALTNTQIQSVLDSYSIGLMGKAYHLEPVTLIYNSKHIEMQREIIETNQGLFLLVNAESDLLHDFWWNSKKFDWEKQLKTAIGVKHALIFPDQKDQSTVHRFDLRFYLFEI